MDQPPDPAISVYVTRTALGPEAGRFACEDHLETLLAQQGYQIFVPEQHSIAEQVAMFQRAGRLIFAEGSAVHLFSLVRRPGQISAVIHRRPELPAVMLAQMADRAGEPTRAVNVIADVFWPPRRGDHLGLSVLDFAALGRELAAMGLIDAQGWLAPSEAMVQASLRAGLKEGDPLLTRAERAGWLRQLREKKGKP